MARPLKPARLHEVQGTARKNRMEKRAAELQLSPGSVGVCPAWMSPEAKVEWRRLVKDPEYSQILSPAHRSTLVDYCLLYGKLIRSARGMKAWLDGKQAADLFDGDGKLLREAERESLNASEGNRLHSLRMQLGLTPASQAKIKAPAAPPAESPWAARDRRMSESA